MFENLRFRGQVYGLRNPHAAIEAAMADFELADFARISAGRLSGGWARRLQIAAALLHSPRLAFLEEPTVTAVIHGLAHSARRQRANACFFILTGHARARRVHVKK